MRNYLVSGKVMTYTAPAGGVTSGVPVLIGSLLVVPNASADVGKKFAGEVTGVFSYTKDPSQAWTEGQKIYWNTTTFRFSNVASGAILVGVAAEAVGSGAGETIGKVRLDGVTR